MSSTSFENPPLSEERTESDINIEEVSNAVSSGLESLQRKWESVPERDEMFLSEAEKLFMKRHGDEHIVGEGFPEKINEYFSGKRKDLQELNFSGYSGAMSKISGNSIGECRYIFLDKIVNLTSPKEVSMYAEALLERVSRMISDANYNRGEVRKIRNVVTGKSYNMFGYDSQKTTETLDNLSVKGNSEDDSFIRSFEDTAHVVKEAVITLTSARLRQLQKPEQPVEKT